MRGDTRLEGTLRPSDPSDLGQATPGCTSSLGNGSSDRLAGWRSVGSCDRGETPAVFSAGHAT